MIGYEVTTVATSNRWDAPLAVYQSETGMTLRRDDIDPGGWTSRTFYPHAIVMVDGEMSAFDRDRQWHAHLCLTCRIDDTTRGVGCGNCRHTGFDQTPCVGCPAGAG